MATTPAEVLLFVDTNIWLYANEARLEAEAEQVFPGRSTHIKGGGAIRSSPTRSSNAISPQEWCLDQAPLGRPDDPLLILPRPGRHAVSARLKQ